MRASRFLIALGFLLVGVSFVVIPPVVMPLAMWALVVLVVGVTRGMWVRRAREARAPGASAPHP